MSLPDFEIETGWGDEAGEIPPTAEWLKVLPGQARTITLLLLPESMPRYLGHWHQPTHQFRRCTAPTCALCDRGQGKQQRFVQAVVDEEGTHWVWEFGPVQARQIKALVADAGGALESRSGSALESRSGSALAGLAVTLMRPAAPGNPPIIVLQADPWLDREALPDPVDAKALLAGVWRRQALLRGKAGEERPAPRPALLPTVPLPTAPTPKVAPSECPPSAPLCFPERQEAPTPDRLSGPPSGFALEYERKSGIPFDQATMRIQANLKEKQAHRDKPKKGRT